MKSLDIFRANVQKALNQLNWSQAELAIRSGIAQPSINIYLGGKKDPNVETCDRIAKALGVSLGALFSEEAAVTPAPSHTTQDCIDAILGAIQQSKVPPGLKEVFSAAVSRTQARLLPESQNEDPEIQKLISLFSSLDESQKRAILFQLEGVVRVNRASIERDKKKA